MTNKTPEEKAVRIAECLSMYAVVNKDHQFPEQYMGVELFIQWLSSPEGEVAMMDKLEEKKLYSTTFNPATTYMVCINHPDKNCYGQEEHYEGRGKTRNEALQAAIIAMLEKGE